MSSGWWPVVGVAATTLISSTAWCVDRWIRARSERERWDSVARFAAAHGPQALGALAELAPHLRDDRPIPRQALGEHDRLGEPDAAGRSDVAAGP